VTTNTKFFIYPYSQLSAGSILLAEELDGKRVKLNNSHYSYKPGTVLINWGNGNCPYVQALNPASAINNVIDKKKFFKTLEGTGLTPPCAYTKVAAANLSYPVVCRTLTEGHDGQGIVIAETAAQLVDANLYTSYIDKTSEYRIHVGRKTNGEVVIIARQKKYKTDAFEGDARIWTGSETKFQWIETAVVPVITVAKEAFAKFPELTFGAFDIVYNNSTEKAYVLEINSAPMLNSDTVKAYADFFRTFLTETTTMESALPGSPQIGDTLVPTTTDPISANTGLTGLVKAQLAAGHITQQTLLSAYTPPTPTTEELIDNYISKISL
jgi:hypothetical protein